jgi:hypothetical protein
MEERRSAEMPFDVALFWNWSGSAEPGILKVQV